MSTHATTVNPSEQGLAKQRMVSNETEKPSRETNKAGPPFQVITRRWGRKGDGDREARGDVLPDTAGEPRIWEQGSRVRSSPRPRGLEPGVAPAGGRERGWYLLVQRVPAAARPDPGPRRRGRPLAAAALQEVHARRAAALLALEVEEHILVESEPLLVPPARLGCLLAQEAALGALLPGQEGQVQGVPLVVAHALLHGEGAGGSPLPRSHLRAESPRGAPAPVRAGEGRPLA